MSPRDILLWGGRAAVGSIVKTIEAGAIRLITQGRLPGIICWHCSLLQIAASRIACFNDGGRELANSGGKIQVTTSSQNELFRFRAL